MFAATEVIAPGSCAAVVLAGGSGSRLRTSGVPELAHTPKALVEIDADAHRQPMLEFVLCGLLSGGFRTVVVLTSAAVGSGGPDIERFVQRRYRDCPGVRLVREAERSGTAGALYAAADHLPGEVLLVVPVDTLLPFLFLGAALALHRAADEPFTWLATSNPGEAAQNSGALLVDQRTGTLIGSYEDGALRIGEQSEKDSPTVLRMTSAGAVLMDRRRFVATVEDLLLGIDSTAGIDLHRQLLPFAARRREVRIHDLGVPAPDLGVPARLFAYGREPVLPHPA